MKNVALSRDGKSILLLDQTQLPNKEEYITITRIQEMFDAIYHLKVRGAPAIGIFAAYGMYCLSQNYETENYEDFYRAFVRDAAYLDSSRPTAVNLHWALESMKQVIVSNRHATVPQIITLLGEKSRQIQEEETARCHAIASYGLTLLRDGDGILTHCNAGPLATSGYGTALGPILLGKEKGMHFRVFADETRPLLQGARLTSYELYRAGVDVTLICDNMASMVMKKGWVQACLVGCDRIAANGDTANKIGTSQVAILARYYGIPFYVLGPTSTIDLNCPSGAEIQIELRDADEIRTKFYEQPMAPLGVTCFNPAFDVTDHQLITGIVTEHGICRAPYEESLARSFHLQQNF